MEGLRVWGCVGNGDKPEINEIKARGGSEDISPLLWRRGGGYIFMNIIRFTCVIEQNKIGLDCLLRFYILLNGG
jgi:hypothetical protein